MWKRLTTALALAGLALSMQAHSPLNAPKSRAEKKQMEQLDAAKEKGLQSIELTKAEAVIGFLADDELQGREAGTHGGRVAAAYLASQLREMGIAPFSQAPVPLSLDEEETYVPLSVYYQPFEAYARERKQPLNRWQVHPDSIALLKQGTHRVLEMNNVLGYIPGERADEYVIVGAHYDHLGMDASLAGDPIYNGADDNASGVQAVLQIARAFLASGRQPMRTVVFALWDGEEKGLLGSRHFVQHFPAIDRVKGYLNFDMIGRNNRPENPRHVVYFYTEAHPAFGNWLKQDVEKYSLRLDPDYRPWDRPIGGGDNGSFAKLDIPIIWYHTDAHPDYHQPGDHADRLNWDKVVEITKASFLNAWNLVYEEKY